MRRISSPTVPNAVVALVFVSALIVGIGGAQAAGDAQAKDCLAAPNVASPAGQHWYYRIDRATHRHCWYLHAMMQGTHQAHRAAAAANENIEHPTPAAPMPAAAALMRAAAVPWPAVAAMPADAAPMPAANPPAAEAAPATDNTASPPQAAVLTVKTIAVRPPGAGVETQSRHRVREASIQEAAARAYRATPASQSEPTMFFFLLFGLGFVTFLTAIVLKHVAPQASWLWPIRTEADIAWQQERRDYSGAGAARLRRRSAD